MKYKTSANQLGANSEPSPGGSSPPGISLSDLYAVFGESLLPFVAGINQRSWYSGKIVNIKLKKAPRKNVLVENPKLPFLQKQADKNDAHEYCVKYDSGHIERGVTRSLISSGDDSQDLKEDQKVHIRSKNLEQDYLHMFL